MENRFDFFFFLTYFDVRVHLENGKETKIVDGGVHVTQEKYVHFSTKKIDQNHFGEHRVFHPSESKNCSVCLGFGWFFYF